MPKALKSLGVGLVVAFAVGGLAFLISPPLNVFSLYIEPARLLVPGFGRIATEVFFSILIQGGTPAGVYLVAAVDWLFWAVIFGGLFFLWSSRRKARA